MKKIFTLMVALVAFMAAESTADAQLLKNLLNKVTGTETKTEQTATTATAAEQTATLNGRAAGAALKALYTQYKADGKKLDMGNLSNIANLATFASNVQGLKGQPNKGEYYMDFAKGLISGSENLVNETNSNTVMSGLTDLVQNVDLSALTQKAEDTASSATSTITEKLTNATDKANSAASNVSEIASAVTNILNLFK